MTARDIVDSKLEEFTGTGAMGTSEGPAPGLAIKPHFSRMDRKKKRRAVQALLGEDADDDNVPEPVAGTPPPLPEIHAAPPVRTGDEVPPWAATLLQKMDALGGELAALKSEKTGGKPEPKAGAPIQPPVEPTAQPHGNVPPRAATAVSANVAEAASSLVASMTPPSDATALVESSGLADDSPAGLAMMGAGMPPPPPPSSRFIRPRI